MKTLTKAILLTAILIAVRQLRNAWGERREGR